MFNPVLALDSTYQAIQSRIKAQAREHERFRRICISFAQSLHRLDMRLRLGLLQDHAAIDRQIAREAAEAQTKKQKSEAPTVKTEAQAKADEADAVKGKEKSAEKSKVTSPKPRIRPLSEGKAIDSGANFISETFLFSVGLSLIVFESWRSRRKETSRREDVAERLGELEESEKAARRALVELEKEVLRLRAKEGITVTKRILPKEVWESEDPEEKDDQEQVRDWWTWLKGWRSRGQSKEPDLISVSSTDTSAGQPTRAGGVPTKSGSDGSSTPSSSPPVAKQNTEKESKRS